MNDNFDGFEWDLEKSNWTLRTRGFNFETASLVFDDVYLEEEDEREDYGEPRYVVTGVVGDFILVLIVIWTPRGRNRRIISARLAEQQEREKYGRFRGAL